MACRGVSSVLRSGDFPVPCGAFWFHFLGTGIIGENVHSPEAAACMPISLFRLKKTAFLQSPPTARAAEKGGRRSFRCRCGLPLSCTPQRLRGRGVLFQVLPFSMMNVLNKTAVSRESLSAPASHDTAVFYGAYDSCSCFRGMTAQHTSGNTAFQNFGCCSVSAHDRPFRCRD